MEKCKNVKMLKYADLNNEQLKSTAKYLVFFLQYNQSIRRHE